MTAGISTPGVSVLPPATGAWEARLGGIELRFGRRRLQEVGEAVRKLGCRRVLLVTDPGVRRAGHAAAAEGCLRAAQAEVVVFDGVEENPTSEHVEAGTDLARQHEVDSLVALGGGSAMDCAKGINFLLTNGGRMEDYRGFGLAGRPMLPSVGVPTTAGTGSEAQSYALIARPDTHEKMACGDEKARFRVVMLDPVMLATAPRRVLAVTGMDAMAHAVESYVSRSSNPHSRRLARDAWRRLDASFEQVLSQPGDARAQGEMLVGAHLAGAAVEASMLGAAHACANPLTAGYGITHGLAVGLMLPWVVRFNASETGELYAELAGGHSDGGEWLAGRLERLRAGAGLPGRLRQCGVDRSALPRLAEEAATQWTARFNPRRVGTYQLREIYETAW